MNLFSKYLKQQRNETDFMNYFKRIEKRDLETKNTELYPKINSATIKISSYFESSIQKFPSLFEVNLKTFDECLIHLQKISIPNKCVCAAVIEDNPGWHCVDCSKYNNSLYCNDCYINSKDLHKNHKVVYVYDSKGMCSCGDPDSLNTYCHEHSGPFVEKKEINDYIIKSFGKKVEENLRKFFDEFFLEFSEYLALTEKCEMFIEELFNEKFKGDISTNLIDEKNDIIFLKSNFKKVFQNFIFFLRLITQKNLALLHLIAQYFTKNNFAAIKLEDECKTNHNCVEIEKNEIKVYFDTDKTGSHNCKCPFFRLFLSNYRNNIKLSEEEDEKEFLLSFAHDLPSRHTFCIIYFFLFNQVLYNNNSIVTNTKSQFYLEDVIELIATKTSFIEDSIDILYKYIQKLMNKFYTQQQSALKDGTMTIISSHLINLIKDLKYFSKPKIRTIMAEKMGYFKRIIDIICLFHNMYEYLSIVPHPEFQDKSPKRYIFLIENSCLKIPGLLNCFLDFEKMEKLKEFYRYIIYKILNQKKEGIKQLEIDEFSFYLILYRVFANFINYFCFNYSLMNNCTIIESLKIFKKNFFESQDEIEDCVYIILKDYFKFFGFLYGIKNNFFNYYDRPNLYFEYYIEAYSYQNDITLLKYLFALTNKKIDIDEYLKLSNIENVYFKFDAIFNLGMNIDNNQINENLKDNTEEKDIISETTFNNLKNMPEEERKGYILRLLINEKFNKNEKNHDDFNIIMQWEKLIEFLIFILKDDSSCYLSFIISYNDIPSVKAKNDLFLNIKNNKYVMEDLKNILQEKIIMNIISKGNLITKVNLEKNIDEYLLKLLEENNIYDNTLNELTYNKKNGENKMFCLKDEYLKYLDFNYFINLKDKSEAQKYIMDFKRDVIKTYNCHFYNQSELTFEFFEKVYENVFLNKNNLELIIRIIDTMINDNSISEYIDKKSIRNSILPIILNYLRIFFVLNTRSFIEFKMDNKILINKLDELLINFVKNKNDTNPIDKDLEDNIKDLLNLINQYQLIYDIYKRDLSKLDKFDYNTQILEKLKHNETNIINVLSDSNNFSPEKKQNFKSIKENLKNKMKNKSNNFMKIIESNEEMTKAIDESNYDLSNIKNEDNNEIMCFYCRGSINLNSFKEPYGKLGLSIKDLFYVNSVKAILRDEFYKLNLKDNDNKVYSETMRMIYNQGFFRIISCGHYFHNSCFIEGCKKGDNEGFTCPLCLKKENILIPPLSLFHDKYIFLKSENLNELFDESKKKEKIKIEENEVINSFKTIVMNFLKKINILKGEIRNYNSFIDNMFPYYKAIVNYFENIFYCDGTTFHKQQQVDNIKNLILSLRLIFYNRDKFEIVKFIKDTILKLFNVSEEKRLIYKYYDSYMHYENIFEKIILSLLILFDYEEIKETFIYLIYIFLPYFCFGLYFKELLIKKQNGDLSQVQFKQKLNLKELYDYLKDDNKKVINYFNSFLKKFCFIKLISDYQNKNDLINNLKELSIKEILTLINLDNLINILPKDEPLIIDIINLLPKTFDSKYILYKLFSSNLNFDNISNSIIENVKNYYNFGDENFQITKELLIQFSPIEFNFIPLEKSAFDFLEKNTGKICNFCQKKHKCLLTCLTCGDTICKYSMNAGYNTLKEHLGKCTSDYCVYIDMIHLNSYYYDERGILAQLYSLYVNKAGTGPKGYEISDEFNLNKENLKILKRNFVSNDFYFK